MICGFVIIGSRYATLQHAIENQVYQLPFEGLDRDVPLSAPDLIELWLATVKTSRDSGRINLAPWFDNDEGFRYCLEDAFISPVMDWCEVVRSDCRVDPTIRDKKAARAISVRADPPELCRAASARPLVFPTDNRRPPPRFWERAPGFFRPVR